MTERQRIDPGTDIADELADTVRRAAAQGQALRIVGGDSKRDILGRAIEGTPLAVSAHAGIVDYSPQELVLTARAGTRIEALQAITAAEGQHLACDPPAGAGRATLGGTLASNLSGPGRPWAGSIRDHVLGVQLINGSGEQLHFGGRVMKNVAGYDVSRAQAGALGTLGVLTEISLKVMPLPESTLTLRYTLDASAAIDVMNRRAGEPKPLTGACWFDGALYLRLSGAHTAVTHTARQWGGDTVEPADAPWSALRERTLPFFAGPAPLWRLSLCSTAPITEGIAPGVIDWGGAQRWLRSEQALDELQRYCHRHGGHVVCFSGGDRHAPVRPEPDPVTARIHTRLKRAFDPAGILNPGRLYPAL